MWSSGVVSVSKVFDLQELRSEFDLQKPLKRKNNQTQARWCRFVIPVLGGRDRGIPVAHLASLENSRPRARPYLNKQTCNKLTQEGYHLRSKPQGVL